MTAERPAPIVRRARAADRDAWLALFDEAVAWLVARGRERQWGREPFSVRPPVVARVEGWLAGAETWMAEVGGAVVGGVALGPAPAYVPAATVPELYVEALVASRSPGARGVGRVLLDHALARARALGAEELRVDCWRGPDGELVRYYERAGFRATEPFEVDGWSGQILVRAVPPEAAPGARDEGD